MTGRYASAVLEAVNGGEDFGALANNPVGMKAFDIACEVDRLTQQIADDARIAAKRFADFADRVAAGYLETDPSSCSSTRDITENTAKLCTLAPIVVTLVHAMGGDDAAKTFRAALNG